MSRNIFNDTNPFDAYDMGYADCEEHLKKQMMKMRNCYNCRRKDGCGSLERWREKVCQKWELKKDK